MIYCLNSQTHSLLEKLVDLCCFVIESQNHLGWKGPLEISAAQTSCSSWASESILPVIISSWVWNVSTNDKLYHFSGQHVPVLNCPHRKKCFLVFRRNLTQFFFFHSSVFSCFLSVLITSFPISGQYCENCLPLLHSLQLSIYPHWWDSPEPSDLQSEQSHLFRTLIV